MQTNKGSSGVDGIEIEDIETIEIEKYLSEIKAELVDGRYKPSPVKWVMIPKQTEAKDLLEYQRSRTELCRWLPR